MRKKVRFKIPENQKIKLEEINTPTCECESLENYQDEKIYVKKERKVISKKDNKKNILSSSGNIISVLLFLTITIVIIFSIVKQIDLTPKPDPKPVEKINTTIIGNWQSSYNGLFIFNEDNTFYWYNSYKNQKDNYYRGTYNYKTGLDALREMGYTEEEFAVEFGSNIKLENIYSINLKPNYVFMSGIDITSVELNKNETWWYILMIEDDGTAFGYNKTLDLKYNLIKQAE